MNYRYLAHVTAWLTIVVSLFGMILLAGLGIADRIGTGTGLCLMAVLAVTGYLAGMLADATEDF